MSIFDKLFGTPQQQQAATPAPTPQPQQPGNLPATPLPTTAPEGVPGNIDPAAPKTPESPLDQFKDLWQNDPNAENKNAPINFNVDQTKLMEAASKVDFTKILKQEDLQAISAGGEGAVAAFAKSLNSVAQSVYAQNAMATSKIVEAAVAQAQDRFASQIPDMVKKQNLSNSLREENPALSHPAAAPILTALENQLTVKYPNATGSEIKKMATDYLSSFATAASPKKEDPATTATSGKKEQDWTDFLS